MVDNLGKIERLGSGRQTTEDGRQETEARRRRTEDRGQKTDSGWIGIFDIDYLLLCSMYIVHQRELCVKLILIEQRGITKPQGPLAGGQEGTEGQRLNSPRRHEE